MRKTFKAEVTDEGTVTAVIATLGVKDHDGDVAFKSSFPADGTKLVMSAYGHKSWDGQLPLGFGTLEVSETEAVVKGQFLMDSDQGRNAYVTVKALSEQGLQEWSYSLTDIKAHRDTFKGETVRILDSFEMKEFSPTLKGAGIDTRTLAIKDHPDVKQSDVMLRELLCEAGCARWPSPNNYVYLDDFDVDEGWVVYCVRDWGTGEREMYQVDFTRTDTSVTLGEEETPVVSTSLYLPKGIKFAEHSRLVLAEVEEFAKRAGEVVSLRAQKGKSISEESKSQILKLRECLDGILASTPTQDQPVDEELVQLFLRSQRALQRSV